MWRHMSDKRKAAWEAAVMKAYTTVYDILNPPEDSNTIKVRGV